MTSYFKLETIGNIAILTLDNPPANSLSREVVDELDNSLDRLYGDKEVRCLILTAGGERLFASGADIKGLKGLDESGATDLTSNVRRVLDKLLMFPRPVIAALNGSALGGGLELSLHCDFRVSVEGARLGVPEINLALIPAAGGIHLLPQVIGLSKARWMLYTGETISATEALAWGLIDRIVPSGSLREITLQFAAQLASKAPLACKALKEALRGWPGSTWSDNRSMDIKLFGRLCNSKDKAEGVSAFLEKRQAHYTGE